MAFSLQRVYLKEKADENGNQKVNLTQSQKQGLKKLKVRIKNGEIVCLLTDKSGKICVTTMDNYLAMGKVHTDQDQEVNEEKVAEIERDTNGHVSMWQKILNLGSDWNHQERIRESVITHSRNVATLSLLVKDHKPPGSFDPKVGPATRPVHNSKVGLDTALSDIVSNFLEPIMDIRDDTNEVISTEDQQSKIDDHNERVNTEADAEDTDTPKETLADDGSDKEYSGDTENEKVNTEEAKSNKDVTEGGSQESDGCGSKSSEPKRKFWPIFNDVNSQGTLKRSQKAGPTKSCENCKCSMGMNFNEEGNVIVGGADVVGLYPACKASHSGLLAKQAVLSSKMQFEGINYVEAARYCAMKLDKFEIRLNGLERVLPTRRFRKGTKPGVTGKGPLGKNSNDDELWVFPKTEPTEIEKRRLIAVCVEIGVKKSLYITFVQFCW